MTHLSFLVTLMWKKILGVIHNYQIPIDVYYMSAIISFWIVKFRL